MFRHYFIACATLLLSIAELQAQVSTRRASITSRGGDEGKCTIEVRVDTAAEVEVSGDQGRIRTLAGQPSNWVRFECSSPLPRNPVDFRFKGIDGRGRVELVHDPQSSRGTAVVRIEDPKGGSEGYTFDLLWRGGSDYGNDRDYDRGPRFPNRRGNDDTDRRGGRFDRNDRNVITCASNDGRRTYCEVDSRSNVSLVREHSNSRCREGSTWGQDSRGVWVDRGCRADFEVRR